MNIDCTHDELRMAPPLDCRPQAFTLRRIWQSVRARFASIQKRVANENRAQSLDALSEATLADIGLTHAGVTRAKNLPSATDAAVALHTLSLQRPGSR